MKTTHLTTLNLDLETPDTVHVYPEEIFQNMPARRERLDKKYGLEVTREESAPMGETTMIKLENGELHIYTYYPNLPQNPIRAHEETHLALAIFAITKNKETARKLTSKLEDMSGINCIRDTRYILDKRYRDEVIACLAELSHVNQTRRISDYFTDEKYEEMEEAKAIYTQAKLRKMYLEATKKQKITA